MADVNATLNERGSRYGDFAGHARITQGIKQVFVDSPKWRILTPSQKEALDMVAHKIGRILNGDPNYGDSWHDIAGYATLVEQELVDGPAPSPASPSVAADKPTAPTPPPAPAASSAPLVPPAPAASAPSAPVAPVKVPPKVTK